MIQTEHEAEVTREQIAKFEAALSMVEQDTDDPFAQIQHDALESQLGDLVADLAAYGRRVAQTDAALVAAVDRLLDADAMNRHPYSGLVRDAIEALRVARGHGPLARVRRAGPVRVYVAASITEAVVADVIAGELRKAGYVIESTWHSDVAAGRDPYVLYGKQEALAINLRDMHRSDMTVAWTGGGVPRATYGEICITLYALDRPVVWIQGADGTGGNIFDADPRVTVVRSLMADAVLDAVGAVARGLVAR